jgi:hypothetical protein
MGWVSTPRPGRSTPQGKKRYPLYRRLGGPQGPSGRVRKIFPLPGFDPWTVQLVGSRFTNCAIATHIKYYEDACGNGGLAPLYLLNHMEFSGHAEASTAFNTDTNSPAPTNFEAGEEGHSILERFSK